MLDKILVDRSYPIERSISGKIQYLISLIPQQTLEKFASRGVILCPED